MFRQGYGIRSQNECPGCSGLVLLSRELLPHRSSVPIRGEAPETPMAPLVIDELLQQKLPFPEVFSLSSALVGSVLTSPPHSMSYGAGLWGRNLSPPLTAIRFPTSSFHFPSPCSQNEAPEQEKGQWDGFAHLAATSGRAHHAGSEHCWALRAVPGCDSTGAAAVQGDDDGKSLRFNILQ